MFKSKKKDKVSDDISLSGSPKGLSDGERAFISANCGQPLYVCWIETIKDDSQDLDKRILVIGQFRLFQIKRAKISGSKSVSKNVHYYEVKKVQCHNPTVAKITYLQGDTSRSMEIHSPCVPDIVKALRTAYRAISLGFLDTDGFALDITEERVLATLDPSYEAGPCCGFLETYRAWCDLLEEAPHDGLIRYIISKESTQDKTLLLGEVPGMEAGTATSLSMAPFLNTLRHNIFFNAVVVDCVPRKKLAEHMATVLGSNRSITRLVLRGMRVGGGGWQLMSNALAKNPGQAVQILDLSGSKVEGQGFLALMQALREWPHALHTLSLCRCGLSSAQISNLAVALRSNFGMSLTIHYLDLSYNKCGDSGSHALCQWLEECEGGSLLEYLAARNADVYMNKLAPALLSLKHLLGLDVRGCRLGIDVSVLRDLCVKTETLRHFGFTSQAASGKEVSGPVLLHYLRNPKIKEMTLQLTNISDHTAITSALEQCRDLHTLDLTGCSFKESDLISLVMGLVNCSSLQVLILDSCLQGHSFLANTFSTPSDGRELGSALSALVASNPGLHTLSLTGSYGQAITSFLQPMRSNMSVKTLNITKNELGDLGGQALAECLRTNSCLEHLKCDENNFSTNTWLELRTCLAQFNKTMLTISYPWADLKKYANMDAVLLQRYRALVDDVNQLLRANQYRVLGHEYVVPRENIGVTLSFEHDFTPTEVEGWAHVEGKQADLQQVAMSTAITAEADADSTSTLSTPSLPVVEDREADSQAEGDGATDRGTEPPTPIVSTSDIKTDSTAMPGAPAGGAPPQYDDDLAKYDESPDRPSAPVVSSPVPPPPPYNPSASPLPTSPHASPGAVRAMTEEEDKLFKTYDLDASSNDEDDDKGTARHGSGLPRTEPLYPPTV